MPDLPEGFPGFAPLMDKVSALTHSGPVFWLVVLIVLYLAAKTRIIRKLLWRPRLLFQKSFRRSRRSNSEAHAGMARFFQTLSGYGEHSEREIPQRLLDDIRNQQDHSEILAALLQIVLAIIFAAFYMLFLHRTGTAFGPFSPLPVALALYLAFGISRLWKALSGEAPLSMLLLGLFADLGIVAVFILVFPNDFLNNAALMALSLIFIALRTFRFQPVWVLAAGGSALAVWLTLLLFMPESGGLQNQNNLLVFLTIMVVTAVLGFSQMIAKRNLHKAARSEMAVSDLSHFFDKEVVEKILTQGEGPNLTIAEKRLATIMFIDMRGFSKMSATMSAEQVVTLLKQVQSVIVPVIRKHGGSIDKFMGDGILASFGAVKERPAHAADALGAAQKILQDYTSWRRHERRQDSPDLDIGIGIATGQIVFGIIGAGKRYEYTVIGDAVNIAAKLEKQTKKQQVLILCDNTTAALARMQNGKAPLAMLENIDVDGLEGKVTIWTLE